ncbi:PEP-CTERM putative exosortase interaction domain-containing protein [Opitutaceae bacterium TAV1]|nr:PEP-CTERM putative exosortase interaction domain-containing protein [Opitutaceae bacterium TAV1]
MKSRLIALTGVLGGCLPLFTAAPVSAQSVPDLTIGASATGVIFDYTGYSSGPDWNGNGTSAGLNVGAYVPGGGQTNNQLLRGWFTFSLASIAADQAIESVYLQVSKTGGTNPTGDINLYYSDKASSATLAADRYQDTSFIDTGKTVVTTGAANGAYLIDVTQLIRTTLDNDSVVASFRIQNDSFTSAAQWSIYNIFQFGTGATTKPQLLITYAAVPEPATWAALTGAAGFILTLLIRRKGTI